MCVLVTLLGWIVNICIFIFIKFCKWRLEMHIYKWNGESVHNLYINLVMKLLYELNLYVEYSGFVDETEGNYWGYLGIKNWFYSRVIVKRKFLISRNPGPDTNHLFSPSSLFLDLLFFVHMHVLVKSLTRKLPALCFH